MSLVRTRYFSTSHRVDQRIIPELYQYFSLSLLPSSSFSHLCLIIRPFRLYAHYFEHDDVETARVALLAHLADKEDSTSDTFYLGLKVGASLFLLVWYGLIEFFFLSFSFLISSFSPSL
jgi:hypothetical protein